MKKETVGILTFNQALNYGAVLQAYALKAVCDEMGYETHIIDYHFPGIEKERVAPLKKFIAAKDKKRGLFSLIRSLMSYAGDKKREKNFREFRKKYLSESGPCFNAEDVRIVGYDVLISGSDQIWNYNIMNGDFDPVYFLDIDTDARKIVYAASSHDTPFPLDMEIRFRDQLRKMSAAIGIREKKLADYVEELTGKAYPVVLDPTLLAGRSVMEKIPTETICNEPYILIYQIDADPASDISVKNLEKRFGCKVYTMTVPRIGSVHGRKGTFGPESFLSLLKGAKFLVTNSFHGIALSLIFEKQFYVYENGGVMSRIDGLLSQTGLHDRKVRMVADIDVEKAIDYSRVTPVLHKLQKKSEDFLLKALAGETYFEVSADHLPVPRLPVINREKQDCCGCGACADICPVGAIRMDADGEGFAYPVVDTDKCINCGKCDRCCGFEKQVRREAPDAYGVKHRELSIRESSRSGAAFIGFSDEILKRGGVVYGAAMQNDFQVKHIRAEKAEDRDLMKKAKYVQSSTEGIFRSVEADLKKGLHVLFSGTPCQVAAVRAYLKEKNVDTEKLLCADLVCHGVPSPAVWKDYLEHIEKKYGSKILQAEFRDKEFGWDSHCESFILEGGKG